MRAEKSQVPFKVGDVVKLCEPSSAKDFPPLVFIVKEIKGKWVAGEGWDIKGKEGEIYRYNDWYNTERYLYIIVNADEDLRAFHKIPTQNININTGTIRIKRSPKPIEETPFDINK